MMTLPRLPWIVSSSLIVLLLFACSAVGQTETAAVSGLVTDRTGAAVAGAEVRIQSVERGTTTTTTTNNAGIYVFPSVQPGQYQISIQKQGFKQVDLLGLIVNVQDHIEQNLRLEVGSVAESVTVEASAPLINTQDATVSTVVDRNFAENLPMNGRSFQSLIQLTPGVVLSKSTASDAGQFSVNGQRASANYWMVDGVSANVGIGLNPGNGASGAQASFNALGGTNSLVSVDALQEFRIQTSTYAPEFGRTPGGQISILTRSGTNDFHGSAFDFLRNDVLDANNWFNGSVTPAIPKAKERQNDFGGTLGGPILKDRTFFFFSYEGLRLRLPQTALTTVPCDSTCTVFGNARTMAVPGIQPFFNAYPLPNGPEVFALCPPNVNGCPATGKQGTGSAQFNASYSNPATVDAYSLRIDHKVSNRLTLFGRYNYSPSEITQRGGAGRFGATLSSVNPVRITMHTGTAGLTWAASSTFANDLRFNYSMTDLVGRRFLDNFGGAAPPASLGFPTPYSEDNGSLVLIIFSLQQGVLQVGRIAEGVQRQVNVVDNLSLQKGTHSLKFGVDFRRLSPERDPLLYSQQPNFLSVAGAETGGSLLTPVVVGKSATMLFRNIGIFAQDAWRLSPRFSITYGLRWDVDVAPTSVDGPPLPAVTGFNLMNLSNLGLAAAGTSPFQTTYTNFAPRVGIAYQVSTSSDYGTVLRGGFGVFYDLATSEVGNLLNLSYPFGASSTNFGAAFPLSAAVAAPPPITAAQLSAGTLYAVDPNLELPYSMHWNVAVEQLLGRKQTASVSYIGSIGRRLLQSSFINAPNPSFGSADLVSNTATADYHSLQLQFQRRMSRGLQGLASYTWSHSIDEGSAGSYNGNGANNLVPTLGASVNRGPSDFDIRHAFSAGLTYDVPAPKLGVLTAAVLRGWSLESFAIVNSAPPVNVFYSGFRSLLGAVTQVRANVNPGVPFYLFGSQYPGGKAFNPAAFVIPPVGPSGLPLTQGNLGRNAFRGFGAAQWDFALHRDFQIRESAKLQFRAEMFNILNHPNFGPPVGDLGSATLPNAQFGKSNQMLGQYLGGGNVGGGGFSPLYQIGGPRSIQLALKFSF